MGFSSKFYLTEVSVDREVPVKFFEVIGIGSPDMNSGWRPYSP